jgi:FAD-linked sulfhydryl oxidase
LRVSKEELGRFVWTFFHSIAASYPKNPTNEEKQQLENFLNAV